MLIFSHFVVTTLFLLLMRMLGLELSARIVFLCYSAGVLIDFDHLIFYPKKSWLAVKEFLSAPWETEGGKYHLHSYLQEPWFGAVILICAFIVFYATKSIVVFLPVVAFGLHILMDGLMKFDNLLLWPFSHRKFRGFLPSNSIFEYVISLILSAVALYMAFTNGLF